jgi:hypothetical protein
MRKILVFIAVAFWGWMSCSKTVEPTPVVEQPCVRTYDTAFTIDSYTETDTFTAFSGVKTLDFKLRIINTKSQTGTCDATPPCSNLLTITNLTNKTVTIFYNLIGGTNVMILPNSKKDEVVPVGVFATPNSACITLAGLKASMKVRY